MCSRPETDRLARWLALRPQTYHREKTSVLRSTKLSEPRDPEAITQAEYGAPKGRRLTMGQST